MKKINVYFVKQKLIGLGMVLVSLLSSIVAGEGTIGLLLIPLGIWLMVSKQELIYGSSEERE